ncbi:MAG: ABC transporter permease [Gemmataceae bacterium]|nr:ABC transporter permease [Gemmataceae bacterium]
MAGTGKTQTVPAAPSSARAWLALVGLSWQRQARAHLMVWIALALLAFMTFLVAIITPRAWDWQHWRSPPRRGVKHGDAAVNLALVQNALPLGPSTSSVHFAVSGAYRATLDSPEASLRAGFTRFSDVIVFTMFTTFLLPLWSLSFATEGLGREREDRNLIWLLTRPLSRPAIYLAKYAAILPWALLLNLGGFALLCLVAGAPGRQALGLYWPAVFWGTLAFCALFHLMGAWFRRAAVVAILYSFFLETIAGNLPAYWKRASVSFYVRCLMFDRADDLGVRPEQPLLYLPVDGTSAWCVLAGLTVALLAVGMLVFSRTEYLDLS